VLAGCDRHARRDQPGARPRPGLHTARLTRPSAAAVSGPVLSALSLREEGSSPRAVPGGGPVTRWRRGRPGGRPATGQEQPGEGASSCRAQAPRTSSVPSSQRPAAAPGGRPGMPPLTGPALRAVPAAACSRACGGCWPQRPAATAEPAGTIPGSARRHSRTEHPPAGHATSRRRPQMADGRWQMAGGGHCRRCHAAGSHSRRPQTRIRE
jgi:hypothetical protein